VSATYIKSEPHHIREEGGHLSLTCQYTLKRIYPRFYRVSDQYGEKVGSVMQCNALEGEAEKWSAMHKRTPIGLFGSMNAAKRAVALADLNGG